MPPKPTNKATFPEPQGLVYDESDMALFRAKLSYHATIDSRLASNDTNLISICEHQARIIKRWEMLKQVEKDMTEKGKDLSPGEKKQLAQYQWRFNCLEKLICDKAGDSR